jgi:hypothetical protein
MWQVVPAKVISRVSAEGNSLAKVLNPTNLTIMLVPGTVLGLAEQFEEVISTPTCSDTMIASLGVDQRTETQVWSDLEALSIDLSSSKLSPEQKLQMAKFLTAHKDIFATTIADLSATHLQEMTIDTGNSPPIKQRPYRVSPEMKTDID